MMDFTSWSNEIALTSSYAQADSVMRWWMPHLQEYSSPATCTPNDTILYAEDQVVLCDARTDIWKLQEELNRSGLCLPRPDLFADKESAKYFIGAETIGGAVAMNLPHHWEHLYGNWRDWVIGMRIIQPNGEIVKSGSLAVKNVAGFDIHRFQVGSRGTLGVIAEVTLRVYPLRAVKEPVPVYKCPSECNNFSVLRRIPAEPQTLSEEEKWMDDINNFTTWSNQHQAVLPYGWKISNALDWTPNWSPLEQELYDRAKQILDPEQKLYAGAWGRK